MAWEAERTTEFDEWWSELTDSEQRKVVAAVEALLELGPTTGRPLVDTVEGSRHPNMKELRVTRTMRIFFAFDPQRVAILLIGGDKAGKTKRFYKRMISVADRIYDLHLQGQGHGRHPMEDKRDEGRKQKKEEEQKVRRSQQ
jgi:hypothetical protein